MNEGRIDTPAHFGHIPALDGLRGLAILAVMVFHQTVFTPATGLDREYARLTTYLGGGVDLFFVLSGFLITGILYDSRGSAHYYRNFYARRFLRIVPLYYAVLFVALVVLPQFPHPKLAKWGHVQGLGQVWYWLFLSNWSIALSGSGPRHGVIDLSWTLSIEEQFYLTWPFLVRALSRRALMGACAGLAATSLGVRLAFLGFGAPALWASFLTPARMDALAAGAWIALASRGPGGLARLVPNARRVGIVAGMAAAALFLPPDRSPAWEFLRTLLGPAVIAIGCGALLVLGASARPGGPLGRVLGGPFLTTFGVYSYALYLFHNPIQALIRDTVYGPSRFPTALGSALPGQALFYLAATLPALGGAWLSWRLWEEPWLRLKRYFPAGRGPAVNPVSPFVGQVFTCHPGPETAG